MRTLSCGMQDPVPWLRTKPGHLTWCYWTTREVPTCFRLGARLEGKQQRSLWETPEVRTFTVSLMLVAIMKLHLVWHKASGHESWPNCWPYGWSNTENDEPSFLARWLPCLPPSFLNASSWQACEFSFGGNEKAADGLTWNSVWRPRRVSGGGWRVEEVLKGALKPIVTLPLSRG